MIRARKSAAVVLAALTIACKNADIQGTGPGDTINPGFVTVTLATPNSNDGALLLTYNQHDSIRLQRKTAKRRKAY